MKKFPVIFAVTLLIALFVFTATGMVQEHRALTISGLVRNPLYLSLESLEHFRSVTVRQNDIDLAGHYQGIFTYTGAPLRYLLEMAGILRFESFYVKPIDLAILVKSADGRSTLLSWGEIFYRNASDIIIAHTALPVRPLKNCSLCHTGNEYKARLDILSRKVGLPRLIVATDARSDRSIENIVSIEIVLLKEASPVLRGKTVSSESVDIIAEGKKVASITGLAGHLRVEAEGVETGDGRGFHGISSFGGVSLAEVLTKAGVERNPDSAFIVTAGDNYRSLLSYGEIFLSPTGKNILLADRIGGKQIEKSGSFVMAIPSDLSADRWVRAVRSIEQVKPFGGGISVIGMGCGDSNLISLQALSRLARADLLICSKDIQERFAPYLGSKKVLFDPLENQTFFLKKKNPGLSNIEIKALSEKNRMEAIAAIRKAVDGGKRVALLEYGDPTLYGSWTYWLTGAFRDVRVDITPGISAFNAANAMIGKNVAAKGSAVITVPDGIRSNEGMLKAVAEHGDTLAIFVGLHELKSLMPLLSKHYSADTPVDLVYRAGYELEGRRYKTTLGESVKVAEGEREKFLGIIYIGPCLR